MAAEPAVRVGPATVAALPLNVKIRNHRGKTIVGGYQHFFELTESAAYIWRQIDGIRTVTDIARLIAEEYDIDQETVIEDVVELFTELAEHDVIKISEKESSL
ncbi:PqqD family protein [Streptomyces sp. ASQP_92]|uniref:PqqD family protein n=1 Tax=Streptomyces sp. ASQP_92 TaxID=2979116 RepID=UPI0021BF9DDC|nr:PqqD family protein [Streptomyces sp. ASQP_92]MCT9088891.1 PqqD family protein [Streptomyces sp. ASQP_92]